MLWGGRLKGAITLFNHPVHGHTCIGIYAVVGFHHDEAGVPCARGPIRGAGGRRSFDGYACSQCDGQPGGVVPP